MRWKSAPPWKFCTPFEILLWIRPWPSIYYNINYIRNVVIIAFLENEWEYLHFSTWRRTKVQAVSWEMRILKLHDDLIEFKVCILWVRRSVGFVNPFQELRFKKLPLLKNLKGEIINGFISLIWFLKRYIYGKIGLHLNSTQWNLKAFQ